MKINFKTIPLFLFIFGLTCLKGQVNPTFQWTLGADTCNQIGRYGTKGISSPNNIPGARENSMSWTDVNGNLWLFGGHGYSTRSSEGYLNDLWKYDVTNNEWTWISGSDTSYEKGNYGSILITANTNSPGARQNGYTWTDNSNNLWLFGGNGYGAFGALGYLNDLWKYNITTNQWTWMSGSSTIGAVSVYGTQGNANTGNMPGGRFGGNAWIDNNNNLWLFGGQENTGAIKRLNDLWKYNIGTNQWTWISGANTSNQLGVYGTKGISSSTNVPGSRQASVSWKDASGNFWLFGGYGFPASGTTYSYLNDLWKYDIQINQWTWMSGSDLLNQIPTYGTKGITNSSNMPGARQMSIGWTDNNNDLWMFSAWGYAVPVFGRINDLWKYSNTTNQWTWIAGENTANQIGVYGSIGIESATNIPGARRMSISWKDNSGNLWLFGGNGYDKRDSLGLLNDLWKINASSLVGINQINEENINYITYPQPFSNELTIAFNENQTHQIQILNLLGKMVFKDIIKENKTLDLSFLADGIYLIYMNNHYQKIIKSTSK